MILFVIQVAFLLHGAFGAGWWPRFSLGAAFGMGLPHAAQLMGLV